MPCCYALRVAALVALYGVFRSMGINYTRNRIKPFHGLRMPSQYIKSFVWRSV